MIRLLTVPNSGTNFVLSTLGRHGIKCRTLHLTSRRSKKDIRDWTKGARLLVTVRDPVDVALGNMKRMERVDVDQYDRMRRLVETHPDIHVFKIDAAEDERDEYRDGLADWLGRPDLSIDWIRVNTTPEWFILDRHDLSFRAWSMISPEAREWLEGFGYSR